MLFTRRLFFVAFGLTALIAVGSYAWQLPGLAGPQGISPAEGPRELFCAIACAASLAIIGGFGTPIACLVLALSWRAVVLDGDPFLSFQWDVLLIETAFVAAFYAPWNTSLSQQREPTVPARLLMAALACKVTLESGLVKVLGGDPVWRDLTALTYHWWTQPLPTWTSPYFAAIPLEGQKVLCALMFVFELAAPLMIFGPRVMRLTGALMLMGLQVVLFVAGNYSFYNLLTFVLAIPMLDDAFLRRSLIGRPPVRAWPAMAAFVTYVTISIGLFFRAPFTMPVRQTMAINSYGAFAHMTRTRPEIIVEASDDGVTWLPYEFKWKPGALDRRPDFIAPLQPRLDWQMWFAALGSCQGNPWFVQFQQRLLEGSPPVLALLEKVPIEKPRFVRSRVFEYRFAPLSEKGVWWTRTETGAYCPVFSRR